MDHDYYQILGVEPNADLASLKAAYRRQSLRCHPDRGGNHEEMLLVNEAWEILSNPASRQHYDEMRADRSNKSAREASATDSRSARQKAEHYPKSWSDFEKWADIVANDFREAKYGKTKFMGGSWEAPTSDNSYTGTIFILAGGVLGFFLLPPVFDFVVAFNNPPRFGVKTLPTKPSIPFAFAGLWLGAGLHRVVKMMFGGNDSSSKFDAPSQPSEQPPTNVVIECQHCGQKLRLPLIEKKLTVTCKACGKQFDISPANGTKHRA